LGRVPRNRLDGERPARPQSARLEHERALSAAVDDDLLQANPAVRLEIPDQAPRREAKPPTPEELQILSKASEDARDAIVTFAGLGLRRGEALALRWCDIDVKRSLVHVRRQNVRGKIEDRTKTRAGTRVVSLFPSVRTALEARAWRQGLILDLLGGDERLIFPNSIGGPLEPTNWYRRECSPR